MFKSVRFPYAPPTTIATSVLIIGIAICAWFFSPSLAHVLSDRLTYDAPSGAYQYSTRHSDNAVTQIQVMFDLNDAVAIKHYRQVNQARAKELLKSAKGESLWTTLTFTKPLLHRELRSLLENAGVKPVSYTQVGWTKTGERMGSTFFANDESNFDLEKAAKAAISADPEAPDHGARMAGVMLVDGYITISDESLGQLLKDNRVYNVDTTAHEVKSLANDSKVIVHLSTPFWDMNWDEETQ
ncbi:MAG: hypothetical protein NT075_25055 [Chloroflexi bacterium]|nr:hypothetical protein [Chloroflexota bacterium]